LVVRNRVSINLWFSPTVSKQKPGFFGGKKRDRAEIAYFHEI